MPPSYIPGLETVLALVFWGQDVDRLTGEVSVRQEGDLGGLDKGSTPGAGNQPCM